MAEIKRYPVLRHLRSEPSSHVLRYRRGKLTSSGRGLAFWFIPLNTSIAEIPVDDRELAFLYHARARDFQDVTVQGVITFRVTDPERLAERMDFSIDLKLGLHVEQPLEGLANRLTKLAQQFTWEYLAHTELRPILENGPDEIRTRIAAGLANAELLADMGVEVVDVRISAVRPQAEVEKALQTPAREEIQQSADEATFERRALAVEKERAIQENELQSQIELARREETLIGQRGQNERRRVEEEARAGRIDAEGQAERSGIETRANAERIEGVERARVVAEQDRMEIYRDFPPTILFALAAQKLAGKLERIDHLNLTPDAFGGLLTNLVQAGTERLERPVRE
ncbi:MAG: SPFH domain-containing protein [Myxococcota bacterium]